MLEPLWRCNLACVGCGKIQHPELVLDKRLSPEQCWAAAEECGAPIASIAGGEPLIHSQIGEIVDGLIDRKKFVYLCTNALLLERSLKKLNASPNLTIDVHLDGLQELHDQSVDRPGVFNTAVKGIKAAKAAGFRVATNTTVFNNTEPQEMIDLFNFLVDIDIDGILVSPGYSYEKAPRQDIFLKRQQTMQTFKTILECKDRHRWPISNTPIYLEFLKGDHQLQCSPWGNPLFTVDGWQKPCYLMSAEGYAQSYKELMETTNWDRYGYGRDPRCESCMVHSGYEASAVSDITESVALSLKSMKWSLTR
jgi:hopanoid biosynthesis associated radical SAM protein HpnH